MNFKVSPTSLYKIFIALMLLSIFLPLKRQIKFPLNLTGIIVFIAGANMALRAKQLFKKTQTPISHNSNPIKLHTDGPFRLTRHPMYLGITIALGGVAILTGIIYNLVFPLAYLIIMDMFFARHEERLLETKFGKAYNNYRQRTKRWV